MKKFHPSWVAAAATALLVACSGGGEGDQSPRVEYGKMVTFGDSLSDVGTYNVGAIAASGGGRYTVNADADSDGTKDPVNWTELLATTLEVDALCPAMTGLNSAPELGGHQPIVEHDDCFSYAQGGARVTEDVGPGNEILWTVFNDRSGMLGQLTVPVQKQIQRHLDLSDDAFAANDLVTVMAGGNDLFMQLSAVEAAASTPEQAIAAMGQAGAELAGYVKTMILAKGATRVVVVNVPDAANAPAFLGNPDTQGLVTLMLTAFNGQLAQGLAGTEDKVLLVDAYTVSQDQAAHPTQYGLTNVTEPACDLEHMPLSTSLACSVSTLVDTVTEVATWQYADEVHPTPYGYKLLAQLVTDNMSKKGWL